MKKSTYFSKINEYERFFLLIFLIFRLLLITDPLKSYLKKNSRSLFTYLYNNLRFCSMVLQPITMAIVKEYIDII